MGLGDTFKGMVVRRYLHQYEEEYPMLKDVRTWLNGKKTFIGLSLLWVGTSAVPWLATQVPVLDHLLTAAGVDPVKAGAIAAGVTIFCGKVTAGVGLIHKAVKQLQKWGVLDGDIDKDFPAATLGTEQK